MGLYDDITADISEAFDGDLNDAVKSISVIAIGAPVYDPVAGTNTPINTPYTTRGVVTSLSEEDIKDDQTLMNGVSLLILDSEKTVPAFEIGMKVLVDNDPQTYKLKYMNSDPANVTHTLKCGRWS